LRISEVARRVGISSSALRAWEALASSCSADAKPLSLYTEDDVRLLQRAIFYPQRSRPQILPHRSCVETPGVVSSTRQYRRIPVSVSGACERAAASPRAGSASHRRVRGVSQQPPSRPDALSISHTLAASPASIAPHPLAFETAGEHPRLVRPAQRKILETNT